MLNSVGVIRRVTKRTYDKYDVIDYDVNTDNLNPLKPTNLETQFSSILHVVKTKIINAYNKKQVTPPEDIFEAEVSPTTLLSAVDNLIKNFNGNPLKDLRDTFGNDDVLPYLASPGNENQKAFLNNPLVIDCEGVVKRLQGETEENIDNDNEDNDLSSSSSSDINKGVSSNTDVNTNGKGAGVDNENYGNNNNEEGENSGLKYKINYENLLNENDKNSLPSEYTSAECPIKIPNPSTTTLAGINYTFSGWYYDSIFNEKVSNKGIYDHMEDITLYALFKEDNDNTDTDLGSLESPAFPSSGEDDCELIELTILQIILVIIIILQVLVKVLVLVLNIKKAIADILKDAELAWINPPSLESLIAYVLQRLGAVIFQIITMLLLKIWSLLNLDCISQNATSMLDSVNSILSGMTSLFNQLDALAINLNSSGNGKNMLDKLKASIEQMGQKLKEQGEEIANQFSPSNMKSILKDTNSELADVYTSPETYMNLIPSEIKNKLNKMKNTYESTKKQLNKLKQSYKNMSTQFASLSNGSVKGSEEVSV